MNITGGGRPVAPSPAPAVPTASNDAAVPARSADAGPRAAHKAWADRYENPSGVAKLIRRDAKGNLLHADDWRRAEGGLIGTLYDRDFAQVVRRLQMNRDAPTLNRLKASILQRAYEAASKGAVDAGGNAVANGAASFRELNRIGMPKLRAIFSLAELADIAATGRAAIHLNSHVPGTFNTSNTASAALSNDMARRMMAAHGLPQKGGHAVGTIAGASMLGGAATLLGHTVAGPAAAITIPAVKLVDDAFARRASARMVAQGLADAGDLAAARAVSRARQTPLGEGLRRHAAARGVSQAVGAATTASDRRRELAEGLRGAAH